MRVAREGVGGVQISKHTFPSRFIFPLSPLTSPGTERRGDVSRGRESRGKKPKAGSANDHVFRGIGDKFVHLHMHERARETG